MNKIEKDIAITKKFVMQNYYRFYRQRARSKRLEEIAIRKIKNSGLFDSAWYVDTYASVKDSGLEPELHYLSEGADKGMNPHPLFHSSFYLENNSDILHKNLNPLVHYIDHGAREGRNPNPLFDVHWYIAKHMGGLTTTINPLVHFLANDNDPSDRFEARWYIKNYNLGTISFYKALIHYFDIGVRNNFSPNEMHFRSIENEINRIQGSVIFNEHTYASIHPDVMSTELRPAQHYYFHGAREGRIFSMLFNLEWYKQQCPGLNFNIINPVLHYLDKGAALGVSPSTWFDAIWYMRTYPNWISSGLTPLAHFILRGGIETSPSPRFDGPAYYRDYPEVAQARINPLEHYLNHGMREGRRIRHVGSAISSGTHVSRAKFVTLKSCHTSLKQTALMVSHAPSGKLKGHVGHYIKSLTDNDISVVLVVAADQRKTYIPQSIIDLCDGVYIRQNSGYDFAAWAHIIAINQALLSKDILLLINDSLIGPLNDAEFTKIISKVRESKHDIIGLTDNYHHAWHVQSFFIALKKNCLCSYSFNKYIQNVSILENKDAVILEFELTFSMQMMLEGLSVSSIFPMRKASGDGTAGPGISNQEHNRTILEWDWMLRGGFPFIKGSLINGEHKALFGNSPRHALAERGFDVSQLDPSFVYEGDRQWADLESVPKATHPLKVSFIGPTPYKNGLGVAARSYLRALYQTPWDLNVRPIEAPFHVHSRMAPAWQVETFAGRSDVVLIHINGEGWNNLLSDDQKYVVSRAGIRIGLFVWETSVVPADWLPNVNRLDAIWVPTEFCARIFRQITDVPVHVVPYVVENEPGLQVDYKAESKLRLTYRLDLKRRIILYAFDGSSFLARKNPHALIRAFRASKLYDQGWQLVLKTKHVFDLPMEGERLFELVGGSDDVKVIDQPMTDYDFRTLFSLSSIYASSHSSEGFGLTIAEAMEMGKIVVATDYGGSRDFLDETCGFPVKAEMVKLSESYGPYIQGAEWGQVDEADLVRALRAAANTQPNGAIAAAAKARIRSHLSIKAVARAMEASLEQLVPVD